MRKCKYINCKKELPIDLHKARKYCPNTECYSMQNQLEAADRRDEARSSFVAEERVCDRHDCSTTYTVAHKGNKRRYCSDECAAKQKKESQTRRNKEYQSRQKEDEESVKTRGEGKSGKSKINPFYLKRGNISDNNRCCSISVSA